ncbi:glycosyl transferase [Microbispora rosea subsp. aerata]|nr:glycosyl transferase [Microbispora rosea subsp. aerata]GIH56431.1 glycosyl transferase [Microbispora rosea subsp. aerata]GLJ84402.1 glycosyl transferase [Microbispora rosea subsp. aerata]
MSITARGYIRSVHVLRLCSVFAAPVTALYGRGVRFDPVGGMQNHCARLSEALDRLGVRQTIVTTRPPTAPRTEDFGRHGRVVRLGLPVTTGRQLYAATAWPLLPRLAEGADLVHAHLGEDLAVVPLALRAAGHAGVPFVLTIHCSPGHTVHGRTPRALLLRRLGGALERRGAARADAVIALTPRMRDILTGGGVPAGRVHVIPSGIAPVFTRPARPGVPLDGVPAPRVLYVGRLHEHKGVDVLLRALALLGDPPVDLLVVGDGPRAGRLRELAERLGVAARVHLRGFVPHEQIPGVLGGGDPLVLPSRCEELGTVLIEAMHSGNPIVATRVGGIPDLVEDGVTGLLVPPGRPGPLAAAIRRLLDDPAQAEEMAANARRRVADLSWDRLVHRVHGVYDEVLRTRPAARP